MVPRRSKVPKNAMVTQQQVARLGLDAKEQELPDQVARSFQSLRKEPWGSERNYLDDHSDGSHNEN